MMLKNISKHLISRLTKTHWILTLLLTSIVLASLVVFAVSEILLLETGMQKLLVWVIVFAVFLLITQAIYQVVRLARQYKTMKILVDQAELKVFESQQQKEAFIQVSKRFVEASDERDVIELVLKLSIDLVGASGASFVPLDERGQPMTAFSMGEVPFPVVNDWVEYLASPNIRERCQYCETHGEIATNCPLLTGPYSDAIGMFCLPLFRGSRELGVLNIYLSGQSELGVQAREFLRVMVDETALALEGIRLRRREIEGLRQMQSAWQKTDLHSNLESLLENAHKMVEADFAILSIIDQNTAQSKLRLSLGEILPNSQPFIDGIIDSVTNSRQPVILGDFAVDPESKSSVQSLLAVPCCSGSEILYGALLVGSGKPGSFQPRQILLMQTVADQLGQIIENSELLTRLEYKTMMEERTRLAREIHDGLAQTLGFLKLQIANMKGNLAKEEFTRLKEGLDICYETTNEAYIDARQAIDGLRIWPDQVGLEEWIRQIISDSEETSGIGVEFTISKISNTISPEIQVQMIRIIQESLSNVRKHSQANLARVSLQEKGGEFILEIVDNGVGFAFEDVSTRSQHGLTGMRERAELIGADFQITSREGRGTSVQLRFPAERPQSTRMGI